MSQLAYLSAGFNGLPGNGNGTWNGLPVIAQGNNVDGVISSTSRMKFSGNQQPAMQARLEDIQEMTVQTDQLDVNQGFGATNMQVNFITRRGTNQYHGRVFDNYQNDGLNANSWANNAAGVPRNKLILNDFGGSIGGPILKDKLFFFAGFAMSKQPGSYSQTNNVLSPAAQGGLFTFTGTDGNPHSVQLMGTPTSVAATNGLPNSVNTVVAGEQSKINGVLSLGALTPVAGDPTFNCSRLRWKARKRTISQQCELTTSCRRACDSTLLGIKRNSTNPARPLHGFRVRHTLVRKAPTSGMHIRRLSDSIGRSNRRW